MFKASIKKTKNSLNLAVLLPIAFVVLAIPPLNGYDTDFAYYATAAQMIFNGLEMYGEVYDHKPPLYHHVLILGAYLNDFLGTKFLGFFCVHLFVLGGFYCASLALLKQIVTAVGIKRDNHLDLLLFSLLTSSLFVANIEYNHLNASIVYFATTCELFGIVWFVKGSKKKPRFDGNFKNLVIPAIFVALALLTRVHFAALLAICIFLIFNSNNWWSAIKNLVLFGLITICLIAFGLYFLAGNFEDFFQAVIVDNLSYTEQKTGRYPIIFPAGFYALKSNIFVITLVVLSAFAAIIQKKSVSSIRRNLSELLSIKLILFLLVFIAAAFFVIMLTRPGGNSYRYYGLLPLVTILGIILIASFSSTKLLKILSTSAMIITLTSYTFVLTKVEFKSWEKNELIAILDAESSNGEVFFTADFNSWLYLATDTLPLIKSQFLKELTFPTKSERIDVFEAILTTDPKFIIFSAEESGHISSIESFVIKNSNSFSKAYRFYSVFDTPYKRVRLWERKL